MLALCTWNSPVTDEVPAQMPVTRSFDVFFDLRLTKRLNNQSRSRWFGTPSGSLWRHCNVANLTPLSCSKYLRKKDPLSLSIDSQHQHVLSCLMDIFYGRNVSPWAFIKYSCSRFFRMISTGNGKSLIIISLVWPYVDKVLPRLLQQFGNIFL